jgi:hypothetical protein
MRSAIHQCDSGGVCLHKTGRNTLWHNNRHLVSKRPPPRSMTQYKRELQIFRDGSATSQPLTTPLAEGQQGTEQTLQAMSDLVRNQRTQPDLQRFVEREIVAGVAGHDFENEIDRIFRFCQSRITYRRDPFGVERVADIWSTLYALGPEPVGDCGIKSCFFAACAALQGFKPFFVVIRQDPASQAFDHVYAGVWMNDTRHFFDPTPEDKPAGWQAPSVATYYWEIFQ